jgi:hypothetical protein
MQTAPHAPPRQHGVIDVERCKNTSAGRIVAALC